MLCQPLNSVLQHGIQHHKASKKISHLIIFSHLTKSSVSRAFTNSSVVSIIPGSGLVRAGVKRGFSDMAQQNNRVSMPRGMHAWQKHSSVQFSAGSAIDRTSIISRPSMDALHASDTPPFTLSSPTDAVFMDSDGELSTTTIGTCRPIRPMRNFFGVLENSGSKLDDPSMGSVHGSLSPVVSQAKKRKRCQLVSILSQAPPRRSARLATLCRRDLVAFSGLGSASGTVLDNFQPNTLNPHTSTLRGMVLSDNRRDSDLSLSHKALYDSASTGHAGILDSTLHHGCSPPTPTFRALDSPH